MCDGKQSSQMHFEGHNLYYHQQLLQPECAGLHACRLLVLHYLPAKSTFLVCTIHIYFQLCLNDTYLTCAFSRIIRASTKVPGTSMPLTIFHYSEVGFIGFISCIGKEWGMGTEGCFQSSPSCNCDVLPIKWCSIIPCSKTCWSILWQIYFLLQFHYSNIKGFSTHLFPQIVVF